MVSSSHAFIPLARQYQHNLSVGSRLYLQTLRARLPSVGMSSSDDDAAINGANIDREQPPPPANLVSKDAFVTAIDALKQSMNVPPESEEEAAIPKMYAIGKLDAKLPIELAGGISLADCETLTLVNGLTQQVADETGIQPLDTIVSISAGSDGGEDVDGSNNNGEGYSGDTSGANLDATAAVYTAAIEYAMENDLKVITLEMNRLVTLKATSE